MTATFHTLRDTRLPKVEKAISLLHNLVRYDHSEQDAKDLVNTINDAADDLDAVFAKKWGWQDDEVVERIPVTIDDPDDEAVYHTGAYIERKVHVPQGTADGGASFEAEVRWALDAIKRGDKKLAANRLERILKGQADD